MRVLLLLTVLLLFSVGVVSEDVPSATISVDIEIGPTAIEPYVGQGEGPIEGEGISAD